MDIEDLDQQGHIDKLTAALRTANESATASNTKLANISAKFNALQKEHQLTSMVRRSGKWKDVDSVVTLISDQFELGESGHVQPSNSRRSDEVFEQFRKEHWYLVGEMDNEPAAKERKSLLAGKYAIADIFGKNSSAKKAAALMNESPSEYGRGKQIAKSSGLI